MFGCRGIGSESLLLSSPSAARCCHSGCRVTGCYPASMQRKAGGMRAESPGFQASGLLMRCNMFGGRGPYLELYIHAGLESHMSVHEVSKGQGLPLRGRGRKGQGASGIEVGDIADKVRSALFEVGSDVFLTLSASCEANRHPSPRCQSVEALASGSRISSAHRTCIMSDLPLPKLHKAGLGQGTACRSWRNGDSSVTAHRRWQPLQTRHPGQLIGLQSSPARKSPGSRRRCTGWVGCRRLAQKRE